MKKSLVIILSVLMLVVSFEAYAETIGQQRKRHAKELQLLRIKQIKERQILLKMKRGKVRFWKIKRAGKFRGWNLRKERIERYNLIKLQMKENAHFRKQYIDAVRKIQKQMIEARKNYFKQVRTLANKHKQELLQLKLEQAKRRIEKKKADEAKEKEAPKEATDTNEPEIIKKKREELKSLGGTPADTTSTSDKPVETKSEPKSDTPNPEQ